MRKYKLIKVFTVLLVTVALSSCKGDKLEHIIIVSKTNETFFSNQIPDGWCRFFYKTHENSTLIEFQDKCDKYNVGDTIK